MSHHHGRNPQPRRYWSQGDFHVLYLLAQGKMPVEIAHVRRTSYSAVKKQIHLLREERGVATTHELVDLFKSSNQPSVSTG